MSEEFPYPCCRCGFCCLSEQCPTSLSVYGKSEICPALSFEEADVNIIQAVCNLPELIPFGDGCCMAARCFKDGVCYDFASLPTFVKILMAQSIRK